MLDPGVVGTDAATHQVTAIISHFIRPGREQGYEEWLHGIATAAHQFKGHLGVSVIRPCDHAHRDGNLVEYANNLGLDVAQFLRDIARRVHVGHINENIESGIRSGVTSTPALFINGVRYTNALELEPLLAAILASENLS